MELIIDTVGKETAALEALHGAGVVAMMDPLVSNVIHVDDSVDVFKINDLLLTEAIAFQFGANDAEEDEESEDDDDEDDETEDDEDDEDDESEDDDEDDDEDEETPDEV